MALIPGIPVLTERVPELTTPRGFFRAVVTVLGALAVVLWLLLYVEGKSPFGAFVLQLAVFGAAHWLISQSVFGTRRFSLAYSVAFFNRFLVAGGLVLGSLFYILFNGGAVPEADYIRLVPRLVAGALAVYLVVTGLLLLARTIRVAGIDTLALLYNYYPDEGKRLSWSVYELLRHPLYSGLDRLALAFGLWNGSAYAMLLAVVFVFVWHPVWYELEEEELIERFGDEYREYRDRVPAVFPQSLRGELALLEALTRRAEPAATDSGSPGRGV